MFKVNFKEIVTVTRSIPQYDKLKRKRMGELMKAYILKVEMVGLEPPVWRRVILPAGATFQRLHAIIQDMTNFQSEYLDMAVHFHEFRLPEENLLITNEPEVYEAFKKRKKGANGHTVRKPQSIKIDEYLEKYGRLSYTYDFGDDWQFDIRLEEIVEDYHFGYPTLLDGAGDAPPEDVGGVEGFKHLLQVLSDESHPEFEDMLWWSKEQRFNLYNRGRINRSLDYHKIKKTEWDKIEHVNYKVISDKYRPVEENEEGFSPPADFDANLFWSYVQACTHLYGVVPLDKVLEIFNRQNPKMYLLPGHTFGVMKNEQWKERMEQSEVAIDKLDFVHKRVLEKDVKSYIESSGAGKDWYVPAKENLLNYADDLYIEPTAAYQALRAKLKSHFHKLNSIGLYEALREIKLLMQVEQSTTQPLQALINLSGVNREQDLNELLGLFSDFANHTRLWVNRGHQPAELFRKKI